jgi:DNA polymerase III subunit delta'
MSDAVPLHPLEGHREIRDALGRALARGTLPSALLLHGPRGVGKQRLALWLGQALVCENPGVEGGCGHCRGCRMALRLEHPDLHWTMPVPRPKGSPPPDKLGSLLEEARGDVLARMRKAPLQPPLDPEDESRPRGIYLAAVQLLRREAAKPPTLASRRLFLIAEAQHLVPQESSPEAANALLKLLEEPPDHAVFVLTSSEVGRILPTIRSRSVPVHLGSLREEDVERFLVERAGVDPGTAATAAALGGGSIGRALGFVPPPGGGVAPLERIREEARELLAVAASGDRAGRLAAALGRSATGARGLLDLLASLEGWLRDLAAASAGAEGSIQNRDRGPWLTELARMRKIHPVAVDRARGAVDRARVMASGNVNPQLLMTGLLREMADILPGDKDP